MKLTIQIPKSFVKDMNELKELENYTPEWTVNMSESCVTNGRPKSLDGLCIAKRSLLRSSLGDMLFKKLHEMK